MDTQTRPEGQTHKWVVSRVSPDFKEQIEHAAWENKESISKFVRRALEFELARHKNARIGEGLRD